MASTTAQVTLSSKATGNGSVIDFLTAKSRVSMILVAKGTVTGGLVAIEGSHDGLVWAPLRYMTPKTGVNEAWDMQTGAYRYFRARVVSDITGGGSVDATLMEGN